MAGWAVRSPDDVVLEPGSGAAAFLLAAARVVAGRHKEFGDGQLLGVDLDARLAMLGEVNLALQEPQMKATILHADFMDMQSDDFPQPPTVVLCNPPYTRHHELSAEAKERYGLEADRIAGSRVSRLASLHLHFFLKAVDLAADGARIAFLTPREWLDVNYGEPLKRYLQDTLTVRALLLFAPGARTFPGVLTTSCIALLEKRRRNPGETTAVIHIDRLPTLGELGEALDGSSASLPWGRRAQVELPALSPGAKWSVTLSTVDAGFRSVALGELVTVKRGIATGKNDYFVLSPSVATHWCLPEDTLVPVVAGAKDTRFLDLTAKDVMEAQAADHRVLLLRLGPQDGVRPELQRYLAYGRESGAASTYLARHRRAWYVVDERPDAPILFTYLRRDLPRFIWNPGRAHALNVFHYLIPKMPLSGNRLKALLCYLNSSRGVSALQESGRVYGHGLRKAEPRELARMKVLDIRCLSEGETDHLAGAFDSAVANVRLFGMKGGSYCDILDEALARIHHSFAVESS
jgi:hypothetical protein